MMANQEHIDLIRQDISKWNKWREKHQEIQPDLCEADLKDADLSSADLSGADLSLANLLNADLSSTNLSGADLREANLRDANLSGANLSQANLGCADLSDTKITGTNLNGTILSSANLYGADLWNADLKDTNLTDISIGLTTFIDLDLSMVKGLKTVKHSSPSSVGIDTIYKSQGKIPETFLREAGVPESFLEVMAAITNEPIEYYTCFLSYSSKDQDFAERLYGDLQSKGVRCWYAPEDMKIGDKIRARIDASVRVYDKLLLVLSQHAIASSWVEYEVEAALSKEDDTKRTVLFPVRLDRTVVESTETWARHVQRTRHIGNFEGWKDHDRYHKAFERLLRDLKADAEQQSHRES